MTHMELSPGTAFDTELYNQYFKRNWSQLADQYVYDGIILNMYYVAQTSVLLHTMPGSYFVHANRSSGYC